MTAPDATAGSVGDNTVVRSGRVRILSPRVAPLTEDAFDPATWQEATPASGGRGNAWFVSDGEQRLVLRRYLRGGKAALVSRDRYLFAGLERTRAFREYRLLSYLHRAGLPVPEPVGAMVHSGLITYRAALLTRAVDAAASLWQRIAADEMAAAGLQAVGACVRRFHEAGVWHADLNANNILVDEDGRVTLIDFDRGRQRPGESWKAGNLARLKRSLDKLSNRHSGSEFDAALWHELLSAYRKSPARP